jgi:hypothetical protein
MYIFLYIQPSVERESTRYTPLELYGRHMLYSVSLATRCNIADNILRVRINAGKFKIII